MSSLDANKMSHYDINQVIADANSLMESVYRDLAISPRRRAPRIRARVSQSNILSPEAERQIAIVENVLESVDNNLRQSEDQPQNVEDSMPEDQPQNVEDSMPAPLPLQEQSTNPVVIDLSDSPSCDDVLFVSQAPNEIINLDSPVVLSSRRVRQRSRPNFNRVSRSRSPLAAVVIDEEKSTNANQTAAACSTFKEDNISTESNALTCAICMEPYANRQPHATKCGHIYCKACIHEAIRLSHKCPICKTKLTNKMLIRIFM